jgi:hypothetical protein
VPATTVLATTVSAEGDQWAEHLAASSAIVAPQVDLGPVPGVPDSAVLVWVTHR